MLLILVLSYSSLQASELPPDISFYLQDVELTEEQRDQLIRLFSGPQPVGINDPNRSNAEVNAYVAAGIYADDPEIVDDMLGELIEYATFVELNSWRQDKPPGLRTFQDIPGLKEMLLKIWKQGLKSAGGRLPEEPKLDDDDDLSFEEMLAMLPPNWTQIPKVLAVIFPRDKDAHATIWEAHDPSQPAATIRWLDVGHFVTPEAMKLRIETLLSEDPEVRLFFADEAARGLGKCQSPEGFTALVDSLDELQTIQLASFVVEAIVAHGPIALDYMDELLALGESFRVSLDVEIVRPSRNDTISVFSDAYARYRLYAALLNLQRMATALVVSKASVPKILASSHSTSSDDDLTGVYVFDLDHQRLGWPLKLKLQINDTGAFSGEFRHNNGMWYPVSDLEVLGNEISFTVYMVPLGFNSEAYDHTTGPSDRYFFSVEDKVVVGRFEYWGRKQSLTGTRQHASGTKEKLTGTYLLKGDEGSIGGPMKLKLAQQDDGELSGSLQGDNDEWYPILGITVNGKELAFRIPLDPSDPANGPSKVFRVRIEDEKVVGSTFFRGGGMSLSGLKQVAESMVYEPKTIKPFSMFEWDDSLFEISKKVGTLPNVLHKYLLCVEEDGSTNWDNRASLEEVVTQEDLEEVLEGLASEQEIAEITNEHVGESKDPRLLVANCHGLKFVVYPVLLAETVEFRLQLNLTRGSTPNHPFGESSKVSSSVDVSPFYRLDALELNSSHFLVTNYKMSILRPIWDDFRGNRKFNSDDKELYQMTRWDFYGGEDGEYNPLDLTFVDDFGASVHVRYQLNEEKQLAEEEQFLEEKLRGARSMNIEYKRDSGHVEQETTLLD